MSNKTFASRPFEKLREKIADTQNIAAPPHPRSKKKEEFTAEELFNREMNDVQEILEFRSLACAHRQRKCGDLKRTHRDPDQESLDALAEIASGHRPINLHDTQEYVEWVNPDYYDSVIPKLHEGQFAVQTFLDLHGCTVSEAEEELDQFLLDSFRKGLRCVKIIHGRGLRSVHGPRIKDSVIKRLAGHFRKDILAYVTARQCDGGLGALYILLRKKIIFHDTR
jgi:DNA-nicking Smr family endonuclease